MELLWWHSHGTVASSGGVALARRPKNMSAQPTLPTFTMPARYEAVARLGKGGGGEVWAVRDRVTGTELALKVLSEDAGEAETMALVREAVTLSGLEGLGVPRVVAFGSLPGSARRFLVRELVDGRSLEDVMESRDGEWLRPVACAADQLTVLHRAGLFHGDIKPANVIVGEDGMGTLVDLGLATPWREGGARAKGLTPKYAAPELFVGDPLTVRGEVYALGATLADALTARGSELTGAVREALGKIAKRATEEDPQARYPSIDELASALKSAAKLETRAFDEAAAWPVLGLDGAAHALTAEVERLAPGAALAVVGPRRSGRTTLIRRLSWSLGVSGAPVANVEPGRAASGSRRMTSREVVELELGVWGGTDAPVAGLVVVVDDLSGLDEDARAALARVVQRGARLVAVGEEDAVSALSSKGTTRFEVPPLDDTSASELVKRAVPSLPDRLARHLLERVQRRPGLLRSFVKRLGGRAVTSVDEVDEIVDASSRRSVPPSSRSREEGVSELRRALDTGRFDLASETLDTLHQPNDDAEKADFAIARAKIELARGDALTAAKALDAVAEIARGGPHRRAWLTARARTHVRAGDFAQAAKLAEEAAAPLASGRDALSADALAVCGVALAYLGEEKRALEALEEAVVVAQRVHDARIEAVALGSLAIAHQRGGRTKDAREAYEAALAAAEKAHDAWTLATTRLNLAGLAKGDGDLAQSLVHLEAALDMGRRAGALMAVQQALFNLANLDLYLGRYARAGASIERLAEQRDKLSPNARAQLLGLQAELATRMGDIDRGARLYELCAEAYDAVVRPLDAAEARLEGILTRLGGESAANVDVTSLSRELDTLRAKVGDGGLQEHEPLACIVKGSLALFRGDETTARAALDEAYERANAIGQREWAWRALDTRARLASSQGAAALARRDTDAALAMLEETASKLPRDLREVFWNDPRRRSLRQAHTATMPALSSSPWSSPPSAMARSQGMLTEQHMPSITTARTTRSGISSMGAPLPSDDRLARIFEITRDLAREHDLDRLLQRVTDHAVGLLGAERGLIVLVNDEGGVVAHTARDSKGEEAAQNFSRSVAERVIKEGEPVIATSARDDERLAQAVSVHQLMIQSIACVPIRGAPPAGKTIGALYVETRLRPGVRFREELPTLAAFADQAAIAIEGARLIDENRRRADELEIANGELTEAKDKLAELLGRRTEQLAYGAPRPQAGALRAALALRIRGPRGHERGHAQALRAHRARERYRRAHPRDGRERHRQGGRRTRNAHRRAARQAAVPRRELRRHPGEPPRERALRTRARRLHRRRARPQGPVPRGRERHHPSRRDRRDAPEDAGGPPPRAPGEDRAPRRRHEGGALQRAGRRSHQSRPRDDGRGRHVPRGPLLPPSRHRAEDPRAARARRGHPGADRSFPHALLRASQARSQDDRADGRAPAPGIRLAGQRAPARARAAQRVAALGGERDHDRRPRPPDGERPRGVVDRAPGPPRCRSAPRGRELERARKRERGSRGLVGIERRTGANAGRVSRRREGEVPRGAHAVQLEPRAGREDDRRPAEDILPAAQGVRDRLSDLRESHDPSAGALSSSAMRTLSVVAVTSVSLCLCLTLGCSKEAPRSDTSSSTAASSGAATTPATGEVAVGKPPPDFTTKNQNGADLKLSALKGTPVVVYFYPKDETSGCTAEAKDFRDSWKDLEKKGVTVIGISTDSAESHRAFAKHHELPFHLVSDEGGAIAKSFGVPNRLGFLGRQTFVIGADGNVKKIYRDVDVSKHAREVLADLQS